jgi:hypothetical protein
MKKTTKKIFKLSTHDLAILAACDILVQDLEQKGMKKMRFETGDGYNYEFKIVKVKK